MGPRENPYVYGGVGPAGWDDLRTWIDRAWPVINRVLTHCREAYSDAGQPYGDTTEGMIRWLEEERQREASMPEQFPLTEEEEDAFDLLAAAFDEDADPRSG